MGKDITLSSFHKKLNDSIERKGALGTVVGGHSREQPDQKKVLNLRCWATSEYQDYIKAGGERPPNATTKGLKFSSSQKIAKGVILDTFWAKGLKEC